MHNHPNNFLSGVYYVQVPEGADTINFHDPRPQTAIIRPPVTELTAYNTDQVVVTVGNGTLLLFPAWLPHSVDANHSDRKRISISFNVMFGAFTETMSRPLWGRNDTNGNSRGRKLIPGATGWLPRQPTTPASGQPGLRRIALDYLPSCFHGADWALEGAAYSGNSAKLRLSRNYFANAGYDRN
jgi:hypothetical protein